MAQESFQMDKTDESGFQSSEAPSFCINNCGFFGSPVTMNMCSKCYRGLLLEQDSKAANDAGAVDNANTDATEALGSAEASSSQARSDGGSMDGAAPRRPPNRCFSCNKRVGLTGFKCKCGNIFCSLHRYSDKHNCPFDYKKAAQDAIAKANPVVKAGKLDKL